MSNQLKIVNVLRRFSFTEWGGTETVVWNTSKELARLGYRPQIVSTTALCHTPEETVENIPIHRYPYFYPYFPLSEPNRLALDKKGGNPFSLPMYRYLQQVDADLIHCHTMARLGETVRAAATPRHIPYVVSFHGGHFDVPVKELEEMRRPVRQSLNYGRLIDLFLGRNRFIAESSGIICVGYNEYEIARGRYPDKPVMYLPNGVDIDRFTTPAQYDFRDKWRISPNARMILCVSRIDYQKNQKMLLSLLDRLKSEQENVHLVLIGPVTAPNYYNEMLDIIAKRGLQPYLTTITGVPPDSPELLAAYRAADLFILPSIHEPFGIVVLEAWAAGVPVIASSTGGLNKLIDHNLNGLLFDNTDLDQLANAYREVTRNRQLRDQLVKNASTTVKTQYSWSTVSRNLIEFYRRVLSLRNTEKIR